MARSVRISPRAVRDVLQQASYLAREATPSVARRFHKAVADAVTRLARMPAIGSPYESSNPRLASLRAWRVRRFDKYVIYYQVSEESVTIVRVLHGARDIERLLDDSI
jgi:toxin ParE1/3/4